MTTPIGRTGLARITPTMEGGRSAAGLPVASPDNVVLFDDFLGDVAADQWNYTEGTDSATAAGAVLAGAIGGIFRLTTGDAGTGNAADGACLASELNWKAANGGLVAECRVKTDALTNFLLFFGFTDVNTLEAPIESAGSVNTLTSNGSNSVGFMFDSRMTDDNFWAVGVKADVDATHQDTDVAPVAATYSKLRVELDKLGAATFYIDGVQVGDVMNNAVTPGTALTPVLYASNTAATVSKNVDVDYVGVAMSRA
jgi:hypothetical protein